MSEAYLWLRLIHVLSATLLFGTGLGTAFHMYVTHKSGNVTAIASATRNTILADWLFIATSGIIQPVSGLFMVHIAGYDYFESWLVASYFLYVIAAVCWMRVVALQYRIRSLAVAAAAANSPLSADYYSAMRSWFILGWPAFISLVIIFVLMVMRPSLW